MREDERTFAAVGVENVREDVRAALLLEVALTVAGEQDHLRLGGLRPAANAEVLQRHVGHAVAREVTHRDVGGDRVCVGVVAVGVAGESHVAVAGVEVHVEPRTAKRPRLRPRGPPR